jgi:hypothetical protein
MSGSGGPGERDPEADASALEVRRLWLRYLGGESLSAEDAGKLAAVVHARGTTGAALIEDDRLHRILAAIGRGMADEAAFVARVDASTRGDASVERFVDAVDQRIDGLSAAPLRGPLGARRGTRATVIAAVLGTALAAVAAVTLWIAPRERLGPAESSGDPLRQHHASATASRGDEAAAHALPSSQRGGFTSGAAASTSPRTWPAQSEAAATADRLMKLAEALRARWRFSEASDIQARLGHRLPIEWDPPQPAVHRIRAGGPEYVDPQGNVWAADSHFEGGKADRGTRAVAGTRLGPLYQSERRGEGNTGFRYALPVTDGRYVVYLHFAEIGYDIGGPGQRRFDVALEGRRVLEAFDIAAEVGGYSAIALPFVTEVRDGTLDIDFAPVLERPKLSALEVYPLPDGAPPPPLRLTQTGRPRGIRIPASPLATYRINAGGRAFSDTDGNLWSHDGFNKGGGTLDRQSQKIEGTNTDRLYQSERHASPGSPLMYDLPVDNGRYAVHLHFAEIYFKTNPANKRKFDVLLEGEKVLEAFDIGAEVGAFTAVVKPFVTEVRDGRLNIELRPVLQNPKIAGIEVFALPPGASPPAPGASAVLPPPPLEPTPSDALYRIKAGSDDYIDPEGRLWVGDERTSRQGRTFFDQIDIQGTELDRLYQIQRAATKPPRSLSYSLPLPRGGYRLRLHFAETSANARSAGKRIFDVLVEGTLAIAALDLVATAGFGTVLVKELKVTVTDGALDVELRPVVYGPRIAALEVLPLEGARPIPTTGAAPTPASGRGTAPAVEEPPSPPPVAGCSLGGPRVASPPAAASLLAGLVGLALSGRARGPRRSSRRRSPRLPRP